MNLTRIALAASLLVTGGAAAAQSAADAKCIIVSDAVAKSSKEDKAQEAAKAAFYFYLGRLKDGTTAAQLKTLFDAQAKTLTNDNANAAWQTCVQPIQTKMQLLQSLAPPQQQTPPQTQKPKQPQGR
jgi:hypothetical protein